MNKSGRNHKKKRVTAQRVQAESTSSGVPPDSQKKRLGRDLLFGLLVCMFFFALLEAGLRLIWSPAGNPNDDPFVGFSSVQPLFTEANSTVSIAENRLRFFNEESFSANKPANTFRIFAFGGSTTYGHPFNKQTSFPRWLQEILNACDNGIKYEVINLGGISYASYRILPLMKETLQYKPDLFIVYTGQNEFLERRSYSAIMDRNPYLLSLEAYLERLRLYQALKQILKRPPPESSGQGSKRQTEKNSGPTKTILQDEATTILDRSSGLDLYHRDEAFARGVAIHFRHNLNAMLDLSESAGVPTIFVSPASNLRDFSPFKSEHDPSLTAKQKADLDKKLDAVDQLLKAHEFQKALDELDPFFPQVKLYAQANFLMARALDGLGKYEQARDYFIRARDLDICPLRATSPIEAEFYSVTGSRKAVVVDFRKYVEDRAAEKGMGSGLAGEESFLDHVHPTIELHQQMAVLIRDRMAELGLIRNCGNLTDDDVSKVFSTAMSKMDSGLFVMRDLNLAKTLKWAGKKDEARAALNRILAVEENNPEIHKMLGAYALEDGNTAEAIKHYTRAVQLSGGDPQLKLSLAMAFYRSGDRNSARKIYEKMISDKEATADIIANLGMIYLEENRLADAMDLLKKSISANPEDNLLYAPYALALAISGDVQGGLTWMRKASEAEPGDPSHLYNLAGMYALANDSANCFKFLNLAVDRGFTNSEKLKKDPIFSAVKNNSGFYKILERLSQ